MAHGRLGGLYGQENREVPEATGLCDTEAAEQPRLVAGVVTAVMRADRMVASEVGREYNGVPREARESEAAEKRALGRHEDMSQAYNE